MKTKIKTVHEETHMHGEKGNKIVGVLLNYSIDPESINWKDSFIYIYKDKMYIFFETIVDMIDYMLYGSTKMKRAYVEEDDFDNQYDAEFIDGTFKDWLKWV
jgi:hypothetical protein